MRYRNDAAFSVDVGEVKDHAERTDIFVLAGRPQRETDILDISQLRTVIRMCRGRMKVKD